MSIFESMKTEYVVWCPDRGATKEDGRRISAFDHESAATRWAEWDDARSADYTIVGGSPAEVLVAEIDNGEFGPEYQFTITGETCAVYRARQTKKGDPRKGPQIPEGTTEI
jgi:hypothetical protein